jgi:hypothetical protein
LIFTYQYIASISKTGAFILQSLAQTVPAQDLPRDNDIRAAIGEIRAARAGLAPTSVEEILQRHDEGRGF